MTGSRFAARRDWGSQRPVRPIVLSEWIRYVEKGLAFADDAERETSHFSPEDLIRFNAWLRDASAEAFPPAGAVVRLQCGAWLNAARAFAHPEASPETRTACAVLLREASAVMDRAIRLHQTAAARATWAGRD